MPRVPMMEGPQVNPSATPFTPVSDAGSAQLAAQAGRQAQSVGQGLEQAGNTASNIAVDMQEQANQVRVNDAMNQARQAELDLTFNPQSGYKSLKGDAAITRPDGRALSDEYGNRLNTTLDFISGNLGNEAQKRAFAMQSDNLATTFRGDVESHMLTEFRNHALSVQDGTIKIGSDTAKLNWDKPDKIAPALDSVKAAIFETGRLTGEAASEIAAKMKVATSTVHSSVISEALQNNNPEYALSYLDRNKDGMTADDLLKARGIVNRDMYARIADGTATNVVNSLRTKIQPTDTSRMIEITRQTESGGNKNAIGKFIPGQGTAKGDMQVMDATAAKPGYGIKPEDPTIPGDRSRVGEQLIGALAQKYAGDTQKAWAAYNAGAGNVDKAIAYAAKNGGSWLDALAQYQSPANHKETVDYVSKNSALLSAGGGTPARPTLQNVHDGIRASVTQQFGQTPPMGVLSNALQAGTKQWEDLNKSLDAQGNDAVVKAQQFLISNGGDFTKLPPNLTAAVTQYAPGKMDDLSLFAKHIAKGENLTNMDAYNQAVTYPEELAKMPDATFMQFLKTNFSVADQEKISRVRANEINGKDDQSAGAINNKAFNTAFNYRAEAMGVQPPKPSDSVEAKARYGALQKIARDSIYDAQTNALGRKMTPQEISDHIDGLFNKNVTFRTTFMGFDTGTTSQPLMAVKIDDLPSDTKDALRKSFAARGNAKPSDADMLSAYIKWKSNAKR